MQKSLIVILIIVFFGFIFCNYIQNVRLLTGGKLDKKDFVQTIPFEYKKDLIILTAYLYDDTTSRKFIFDTGAFNSKIEKSLAEELALKTIATKDNSTAQGISQEIEVTRINSLTLGETIFKNIGAGKLEYNERSVSPCLAEHGLIGANLIKLAYWKIDYLNQLITFSDKPLEIDPQKPFYKLKFDRPLLSGVPDINIKIQDKTVENVLFDLGYNGGIVLPKSVAGVFSSKEEKKIIDYSTTGIYGSNLDTLLIKKLSTTIGGLQADIPIEFSSIGKALIGNDFLEHFTVFINYKKKEIILQKESKIVIDDSPGFIPSILSDSLWVINRLDVKKELSLGDTLQVVKGKRPVDLFNNKCDYFFGIREFLDSDSIEVTTLKGDKVILNQ